MISNARNTIFKRNSTNAESKRRMQNLASNIKQI